MPFQNTFFFYNEKQNVDFLHLQNAHMFFHQTPEICSARYGNDVKGIGARLLVIASFLSKFSFSLLYCHLLIRKGLCRIGGYTTN